MARKTRLLEIGVVVAGLGLLGVGSFVAHDEWKQFKMLMATLPAPVVPRRDLPERPTARSYLPAGDPILVGMPHGGPRSIAISHDDKTVATPCGSTVCTADVSTGAELRKLDARAPVSALAFTNDDTLLLVGTKQWLSALDPTTGEKRWSIAIPDVMKVVVSRDGQTAYVASHDKSIHVIDLAKRQQRSVAFLYQPIVALAESPTTGCLAAGLLDGSVAIVKLTRFGFRVVSRFQPHAKIVDDLDFSSDGSRLASAGDDHTTVLSRVPAGDGVPTVEAVFPSGDEVWGVAFSPDGKLLATTSRDGNLSVIVVEEQWRAQSRKGAPWTRAAFTHDGRTLFAGWGEELVSMLVPRRGLGTVLPTPGPNATGAPVPRNDDEARYLDVMKSAIAYPDASYEETKAKADANAAAHPKSALALIAKTRFQIALACSDGPRSCDLFSDFSMPPLHEADELAPRGVEWWSAKAAMEAMNDNGRGAREWLDQAFALAPHDPYTVIVDAEIATLQGHFQAATTELGDLVRGTKRREVLLAAWRILADIYTRTGDIDAAKGAHEQRLALAPNSRAAHSDYGRFLQSINEPEKSVGEARDTSNAERDADVAAGDHALWALHDPDVALRFYDAAIAAMHGGGTPMASYGRAAVHRQRGQLVKAREELEKARAQPFVTPVEVDAIERALAELPPKN